MLQDFCRRAGLQTEYWDIWGQRHEPSDQALRAILASLGLDPDQPEPISENRPLEAVAVLLASDASPSVSVRLPAGYQSGTVSTAIYWEDGSAVRRDYPAGSLDISDDEGLFRLPVPGQLRLGSHR